MSQPLPDRFGGHFWSVPAFADYVQPPLTDDAVAHAEQVLGVTLPATYLALLRTQNGGYLRAGWPQTVQRRVNGIGPKFPNLVEHQAWWRENPGSTLWSPPEPGLLVSFDGDGHWDMCLDYRSCGPHGEPSVAHVVNESEWEEQVAPSFYAFLQGLGADAPGGYLVTEALSLDEVAARLGAALQQPFDDDGGFAHGYRTLRFSLPRGEWCWVTPNRVPASFTRQGERVVTEGQGLRGAAVATIPPASEAAGDNPERRRQSEARSGVERLRYPERPDVVATITWSDGATSMVERIVADSGLEGAWAPLVDDDEGW